MSEPPVYFRIDRPEVVHGTSVFADQVIVSAFYFALQYFVLKKKRMFQRLVTDLLSLAP